MHMIVHVVLAIIVNAIFLARERFIYFLLMCTSQMEKIRTFLENATTLGE